MRRIAAIRALFVLVVLLHSLRAYAGAIAVQVSVGEGHACAVTDSGAAKCWGHNEDGQLGDGTTEDRPTPVDVVGLSSGVVSISAAFHHTCALMDTGGVKCWGYNYGLIGDGTKERRLTPVDVAGLTSGVASISAGGTTCAVTNSSGVKCWPSPWDGSTERSLTPVDVMGLTSGATSVSVDMGGNHTCATTDAGGVKCWGNNAFGQLGDGTKDNRPTPVDVVGLSSGVASVAAGLYDTCALTHAGAVKCWGDKYIGGSAPVDILTHDVRLISGNSYHVCAVTNGDSVKCWGDNSGYQLGDGTDDDRLSVVDVIGLNGAATSVSAGSSVTCALMDGGSIMCWGTSFKGALGNGTAGEQPQPAYVTGFDEQPSRPASILQITTDGSQIMIQKDYGSERWSISYSPTSGIFLGNVFKTDGSPPSFIVCNRTAADEQNLTFSCLGADACRDTPCPGTRPDGGADWASINDRFVVPVTFFQPRALGQRGVPAFDGVQNDASVQGSNSSSLQITPDGSQVLIQKDYGNERWSISYSPASGIFLGNVFKTDGSAPSFILCNQTGADQDNLTFSCQGADACRAASCPGLRVDGRPDWIPINDNFVVPVSFFQPRQSGSTACLVIYADSCVEFEASKDAYARCERALEYYNSNYHEGNYTHGYSYLTSGPCSPTTRECLDSTVQTEIEAGNACPGVPPAPGD